jgi:hypothetical protein
MQISLNDPIMNSIKEANSRGRRNNGINAGSSSHMVGPNRGSNEFMDDINKVSQAQTTLNNTEIKGERDPQLNCLNLKYE